jgi:hypothetical protein
METLTFRCTWTERTIETGIIADHATLLKIEALELSVKCPHCANTHRFLIKSGFLAEAA